MAAAFKVVVYDGQIVRLIKQGDGQSWIKRKANAIRVTAVHLAPARTGRLKASHRVEQHRGTDGRFQTSFAVIAAAPYAAAVHGGTVGPIRSPRGKMLKLPGRNPRKLERWKTAWNTRVWSVRGQKANPWLERAARVHTR